VPPTATLAANNRFDQQSMIALASSQILELCAMVYGRVADYLGATRRALNPPLDFKSELGPVNLHRGELNLLT
jgi:hypothetical protein